jgi:type IV pilus assembly protein PilB
VVATEDPADIEGLNALRFRVQRPIEAVLANPADLDAAIATHCPLFDDPRLVEEARRADRAAPAREPPSPQDLAAQKPVIRLVDNILQNAVQRRASDIHVHPRETKAEVRYRIDGTLTLIGEIGAALVPAIVARIKVLAAMDVAEHRLPQDGAIHVELERGPVDMRVSVMPAAFGENVVIRILDRSIGLRKLADVGFAPPDAKRVQRLLNRNQGLLLVTGPTGSGKTTTLYAALGELNTGEYQIVTVEDPVEYQIDGLVQIRARPDIGYGFPTALRHILRHDPDVIFIGEIRDAETAKIAIESALTGHLVLSTLHTNSAVQTITRLVEIGIPPYLIAATLAGVLAQRLARRNCPACKAPEAVPEDTRALLGLASDEPFWRSKGCDACGGTGYRGRVATYELLEMNPALRELVSRHATIDQMEAEAMKGGMRKLVSQALELARAGTISVDEVLRVRLD